MVTNVIDPSESEVEDNTKRINFLLSSLSRDTDADVVYGAFQFVNLPTVTDAFKTHDARVAYMKGIVGTDRYELMRSSKLRVNNLQMPLKIIANHNLFFEYLEEELMDEALDLQEMLKQDYHHYDLKHKMGFIDWVENLIHRFIDFQIEEGKKFTSKL